ncbi:hypothetical protein [Candidatus Nitrosotalea okcheonensis]|uniref:Uncharacterized protein n=1 Tax=Candidatus Nitrosotalea okcheonensis TaxID=1903276 RepID=A0A2H1FF48_9ARCH|nr:hypothetical protein [Candidatus Nitrosotalea okcheonensis]SMH71299.1 protein of unknown function [Candidatus Nitrosotalea okcheonensis]
MWIQFPLGPYEILGFQYSENKHRTTIFPVPKSQDERAYAPAIVFTKNAEMTSLLYSIDLLESWHKPKGGSVNESRKRDKCNTI